MIPGITALSRYALAQVPAAFDHAVADPFAALLADPDAQLTYLLVASPFDPDAARAAVALPGPLAWQPLAWSPQADYRGGEVAVYLSDRGFATRPDETPANRNFPARLDSPYALDIALFAGADPLGRVDTGFGAITIVNGSDGDFDDLAGYSWAGREVAVRAGGDGFRFRDFATVFRGSCSGARWDEHEISLDVRPRHDVLDRPLARGSYGGVGGVDGGTDLAGRPKPLAFGRCRQVAPVNVDWGTQLWQVHDGAAGAIDAVRDRGVALAAGGDYADAAALLAAAVPAGHYATCLAAGLFRLGSTPAGPVTADVVGDPAVGARAPDILRHLVQARLGPGLDLADDDLDLGALARVDAARPWTVGLWVPDEATAGDLCTRLARSIGGWVGVTRAGRLTMGVLARPERVDRVLTASLVDDAGIASTDRLAPAWRVRVGYRRMRQVLGDGDLAAGVAAADRAAFRQEYRWAEAVDDVVRGTHRDARSIEIATELDEAGDAQDLAAVLLDLFGRAVCRYSVPLRDQPFRYWLGDGVRLRLDRFGLEGGADFLVVGVSENARGGINTLELWG